MLLSVDKINYEVTFNIKINSERFQKTFIIKAENENSARNQLMVRCKKEFKGYKTINKIEIKEATKNSRENSILLEENNAQSKTSEQDDDTKNFNDFVENCLQYVSKVIDGEIDKLDDNVKNKRIFELKISTKDKKAEELLEKFFNKDSKVIISAESSLEAESKNKKALSNLGINREDRRRFKFASEAFTVGEVLKRDLLSILNKLLLDSKDEWMKDKSVKKIEDASNETIEKMETAVKERFEKAKNKLLECLDSNEKLISGETKRKSEKEIETEIVCSLDAKNIDAIYDKGKIVELRRKGSLLFAKLMEFTCIVDYVEGFKVKVKVTATNEDDAGKIITTSLAAGLFGEVSIDNIKRINLNWIEDGKPKASTISLTGEITI